MHMYNTCFDYNCDKGMQIFVKCLELLSAQSLDKVPSSGYS